MARRSSIPAGALLAIVMTLGLLIAVLVMKSRCAGAVDNLFRAIDAPRAVSSDGGIPRDGG